jgi:uncharacterized membrane protein YcfT
MPSQPSVAADASATPRAAARPATAPITVRALWPDLARGATVLLVVAMHLMYLQLVPLLQGTAATVWHKPIVDWTTPLRMPLFFVVSGYLSARMLERSWRAGISGRIAPRAYLYVVWLAITALALLGFASWDGEEYDAWGYFVSELWQPTGVLWYIWALAAFFLVAKATARLPDWLVVGAAALAAISVELVDVGSWKSIIAGFLPFVVGVRAPQAIRALTERSDWRHGLAVLTVAVGMVALRRELPLPAISHLVMSAVCVAAVLMLLPRIAHWSMLRPIRRVGRNTLVIFALHPLLIITANRFLRDTPDVLETIAANPWLAFLLPIVELLLVVVISIGLERVLRRIGLRHVFEMPRFRTQRRRVRGRLAARQSERTNSSSISS